MDGLRRVADESRADGFAGMLAIHPAQVEIINAAFTPTEDELAKSMSSKTQAMITSGKSMQSK